MSDRPNHPTASSALRWVNCSGSWPWPESVETEDMASGTRCHAALESGDMTGLSQDETNAVSTAKAIVSDLIANEFGETGYTLIPEKRIYSKDGSFSGKPDLVAVSLDNRAIIIDYKMGQGEHSEENIEQLLCLSALFSMHNHVEHIDAYIVQPRAFGDKVLHVSLSPGQCRALQMKYSQAAKEAEQRSVRKAGVWCRYCPHKAGCVEHQGYALAVTFQGLSSSEIIKRADIASKAIEEAKTKAIKQLALSGGQGEGLQMVPEKPSFSAIEAVLRDRGYSAKEANTIIEEASNGLVEVKEVSQKRRNIVDGQAVIDRLTEKLALSDDEILLCGYRIKKQKK